MADATNDNGTGNGAGVTDSGANGNGNPGGSTGGSGSDNSQNQAIDFKNLTDEQIATLAQDKRVLEHTFQHPRFKELNEKAKEADRIKNEASERERKEAEKRGEFENLYKQTDEKYKGLQSQFKNSVLTSAIVSAAAKAGISDPSDAVALLNKDGLTVDDQGNLSGDVDAAIAQLIESKPYLTGNNKTDRLGGGSNPSDDKGANSVRRFKESEIADPKFYKEHEDEIKRANKLNLIDWGV